MSCPTEDPAEPRASGDHSAKPDAPFVSGVKVTPGGPSSGIEPEPFESAEDDYPDLETRIELYGILFTKFNQEGDGIWARFNMMLGTNLGLFAAFGYSLRGDSGMPKAVPGLICLAGLVTAMWSCYVLARLWKWHQHWRDQLTFLERSFSTRLPRPHVDSPKWYRVDPGASEAWRRPGYTQPFLWVVVAAWAVLSAFMLTCQI
jgi:hypothetical protein